MHQTHGRRPGLGHPGDQTHSGATPATTGDDSRPTLAHDRPALPQGLDRPQRGGRQATIEGSFRAHQVPIDMCPAPSHLQLLEKLAAQLQARGALRPRRASSRPELQRPGPQGGPPHGRQPPRQRRQAAPGPARARLPGSTALMSPPPAVWRPRTCWSWVGYVRDVMPRTTADAKNFRVFGPDESSLQPSDPRCLRRPAARLEQPTWQRRDEYLGHRRPGNGLHALRAHVRGLAGGLPAHRTPRLSSTAMRPSSASWTPCSPSTPSG